MLVTTVEICDVYIAEKHIYSPAYKCLMPVNCMKYKSHLALPEM
jgi:hypothetical protein